MSDRASYQKYLTPNTRSARCRAGRRTQDQRTGLDDAVDDGRIEREVEDAERLVEVREGRGQPVRQPVPHVDVQLLQLVENVRELEGAGKGRRARPCRGSFPRRSCKS